MTAISVPTDDIYRTQPEVDAALDVIEARFVAAGVNPATIGNRRTQERDGWLLGWLDFTR